ncbi:MAG: ribonuclease HI [Pseudomonadota bacterium]
MKEVIIYCDGACQGNPGPGGWGAILICGDNKKELSGGVKNTTNNQMELTAAIKALAELKQPCRVNIYTDSKYVCQGIQEWVPKWQLNNWRTASKKPVKNKELWQQLLQQTGIHQVNWHWVKGHNGNEGNEAADKLATTAVPK